MPFVLVTPIHSTAKSLTNIEGSDSQSFLPVIRVAKEIAPNSERRDAAFDEKRSYLFVDAEFEAGYGRGGFDHFLNNNEFVLGCLTLP